MGKNKQFNKNFDSDPVYKDKYINTKIRSYNNDIITNFRNFDNKNNTLPEEKKLYKCVSLISLLQECVCKVINKKVENIITNFDLSSESENESDNESNYE